MSWQAEAHRDWHTVNGRYNSNCPLDCGAISPEQAEAEAQYEAEAYEEWLRSPEGREYLAEQEQAIQEADPGYQELYFGPEPLF